MRPKYSTVFHDCLLLSSIACASTIMYLERMTLLSTFHSQNLQRLCHTTASLFVDAMHIMYVLRARHRTRGKTLGQLIDMPHFAQQQPKKLKHLNLCSTHPGPTQRHSNHDDRGQWCSSVSFPFRSIPALALHFPVAKRPICHLLQAATWMVFAQSERAPPDSCECFSFPGGSLSSGARLTVRACPIITGLDSRSVYVQYKQRAPPQIISKT